MRQGEMGRDRWRDRGSDRRREIDKETVIKRHKERDRAM
jgi:hypothetical protein